MFKNSPIVLCLLAVLCALAVITVSTTSANVLLDLFEETFPIGTQHTSDDTEFFTILGKGSAKILTRLKLLPFFSQEKVIIGVIVENHEDARPHHAGLQDALLIEEFLVEGLISRLSAFFAVGDLPLEVGPIRSLRPYFVSGALPWASAMFFAGGSPEALDMIEHIASLSAKNLLYLPRNSYRKDGVPAPHDLFMTRSHIDALLLDTPAHAFAWPPYTIGPPADGIPAKIIDVAFYNPLHDVQWIFDKRAGTYTRINGNIESDAHPSNILILESPIEDRGAYGRLQIPLSSGALKLFRNGKLFTGTWEKGPQEQRDRVGHLGLFPRAVAQSIYSPSDTPPGSYEETPIEEVEKRIQVYIEDAPFRFTDSQENSLVLSQGQTWIMVIESLDRVSWEE